MGEGEDFGARMGARSGSQSCPKGCPPATGPLGWHLGPWEASSSGQSGSDALGWERDDPGTADMPTRTGTPAQRKAPGRPQGAGRGNDRTARVPSQGGPESLNQSIPEIEHAGLLAAQRFGAPGVNGQQVRLLRSLQRRYGNDHVARMLSLVRES